MRPLCTAWAAISPDNLKPSTESRMLGDQALNLRKPFGCSTVSSAPETSILSNKQGTLTLSYTYDEFCPVIIFADRIYFDIQASVRLKRRSPYSASVQTSLCTTG